MTTRASLAVLVLLCSAVSPLALAESFAGRSVIDFLAAAARHGLRIVHSSELVPPQLTVRREPDAPEPLSRIREVLAQHGLSLKSAGADVWVVVPTEHGAIEGVVVDALTGQGLGNMLVSLSSPSVMVRTRADGSFFVWDLVPGAHRLSVLPDDQHRGTSRTVDVPASRPARIELRVEATLAALSEVIVTSSRYRLLGDATALTLAANDIADQPAVAEDALRAVNRFPGRAGNGISSRAHVRGGDANENLVLWDGIPLMDPFHFERLPADLSFIDPGWIDRLDFYSGVLPVAYGGRMSSVFDLRSRRASQPFAGRFSLGLVHASALLEGTMHRTDSSWLAAARRGMMDLWVEGLGREEYGTPKMSDAIGILRMRTGSDTTVVVGALGAVDEVRLHTEDRDELTDAQTEQAHSWITVEHQRDRVHVSSRVAASTTAKERSGVVADADTAAGQLTDIRRTRSITLSQDWQRPARDSVEVRWGWFYSHAEGDYDYHKIATFPEHVTAVLGAPPLGDLALSADTEARSFGAYAGAEWEPFDNVRVDAGMRWERHLFSTGQRESSPDPRLSFLYRVNPHSRWRLAWGRSSQFATIMELPVERGALRYDPPAQGTLWVLGWDHEWSAQDWLRIEIYDKRIEHPWPRLESRIDPLVLIVELEPDQVLIVPDRARMRGIDVYAFASLGDAWSGWLSYSGSRAEDVIAGRSQLRSWDQRHALGLGLTTQRWGWTWAGAVTAHSGWPTTALHVGADGAIALGARNGARLPWYATLDLRAQRSFKLPRGALRVSAELTNATNHKNYCCSSFDVERDATGALVQQVRRKTLLPTVPFLTVAWEF